MRTTLLLMLIGSALLQSGGFADATTQPAAAIELPSFGVAAPIPDGWRRASEPDEAIAVRWETGDRAKPTGVIDLQIWPKRAAASAKALAEKEAKRLGGSMNREFVELAGVEAFEFIVVVEAKSGARGGDKSAVVFARTRIAKHAGNYYALAERSTNDSTHKAFDQITSALKLSAPSAPSDALRSRKEPTPLPAVQFVMELPDPFRCSNDGSKRQDYNVLDLTSGNPEVEMSVVPSSTFGRDFDGLLELLGKSLARQYGWSAPPAWRRTSAKPGVAHTDLMPAGKDASGKPTKPTQVMVVMNNGAAQLVTFQYLCPAPAAEKYAALLPELAKSVHADPGYFAARRAAESAEQGK